MNEETNNTDNSNHQHFVNRINNFNLVNNDTDNMYNLEELEEGEVKEDINVFSKNDNYNKFIKKIIPSTEELFQLVKKNIQGPMSITAIVNHLEPFLIYSKDLTDIEYDIFNTFINTHITNYKKIKVERERVFSNWKNAKLKYIIYKHSSVDAIYNNLQQMSENVFNNGYDYNKSSNLSNTELLGKIIQKDSGRLYNSALAMENIPLMFSQNISAVLEKEALTNKELIEEYSKNNECKTYVIAKQYLSIEELENDNNKDIYFDKKYDKTLYSLLDDYQKDMPSVEPELFIDTLVEKIIKKEKMKMDDAISLADTLISGVKKVSDGQYAFIFNLETNDSDDSIHYYVRQKNVWVLDNNIDKSFFINEASLLCNIKKDCIDINNQCQSTNLNKADLQKNILKDITDQFDEKYEISKKEMEDKLKATYEYYRSISEKLTAIEFYNQFQYNNEQFSIGMKMDGNDTPTKKSPYKPYLDLILGQSDFEKVQNDIIQFTMEYTREALENTDESIHWRYCIKTGAQLMPAFRYTLASVFMNYPANYNHTVEFLKQTIGKKSDDGNAWVDKYSGRVIQLVEFSAEEGYDAEGRKNKSREIMEQDAGQSIIGNIKSGVKKQSHEIRIASNIIMAIAQNMGINIEDQREFIITNATSVFLSTLPSEDTYTKQIKDAANRGKTIPSYTNLYNTHLLYTTMAMFLIGIQISIPSIKTRKTYPGCICSFDGFPMEGAGDYSAVEYVACVAYHMRNPTEPWNVLQKKKQKSIAEKLQETIQTYFSDNLEIKHKFQQKAEYLLTAPIDKIPEVHDISQWTQFLPPLVPIKITRLANITSEFKGKLLRDLRSAHHEQREDILIVQSKIIMFSLALQECIQKVVDKKTPILTNMINDPFLENACCNEKDSTKSIIEYFIKEDKEIAAYNKIVQDLSNIIEDVNAISKAILFYSPINTKIKYPNIKQEFSQDTIYRAFIVYCRFNSIYPIPDDIIKYCTDKPSNISPKESLREMIIKLKNDGRNYTNQSLLHLFQLVCRRNIVFIPTITPIHSSLQQMRTIINNMIDNEEEVIYPALRDLIKDKIDTYDLIEQKDDIQSMKNFKNHLARTNEEMREDITHFVKTNNTLRLSQQKHIETILNDILYVDDSEDLQMEPPGISDNNGYNFIQFIKNNILKMVSIFSQYHT